jgi:GTP diphosphokinase / guanosine-3',5'-bis(diphosphate) 3'-diphosphatase
MRTMAEMSRDRQVRISRETLEIYAPIAHRLGLNQTYRELQDLSFRFLRPWRYQILTKAVTRARSRRRDLLQKVSLDVESAFAEAGISVRIAGREKSLYSIYRKMDNKHLSFAQVTDMYGFRVIVPTVTDCYTALGVLHQLYKPVPGKFKDHIAIAKINGYQSLHSTLVGPASVNIEFQMRTDAMDMVAESGVAAHWLYKANYPNSGQADRLGSKWLQSLLDIQDETRDAAEFWDHIKIDLFPDAVYVFTPKGQILSMPRGATVVDFAYAIHSNVGDRAVGASIGGEQVSLRTEVKNGDVIEVTTAAHSTPNPAWLGFVRTGRARSKIRHHLKTMAQTESLTLGQKLLTQALRAEGFDKLPEQDPTHQVTWDKLIRFTGNRNVSDLLTDIGLGKRIASIVARRMVILLGESGQKPDAVLMTRERFGMHDAVGLSAVSLDGSENSSVQFAPCCLPVPGDAIMGYLGRGEGLVIHCADCAAGLRLQHKDKERFIPVEWADEPVRTFESRIVVTVANGKGVLARVATTIATAGADIAHIDMGEESAQETTDLRFAVSVQDLTHLESVLRALQRTPSVLRATRARPNGA